MLAATRWRWLKYRKKLNRALGVTGCGTISLANPPPIGSVTLPRLCTSARQKLRRWLPTRRIVVVADRNYAALELLNFCQSLTQPVTFITRLRLDAALYEPPPTRLPGQMLPGLLSWVTLAANLLYQERPSAPRADSWYAKSEPTFIDAIALARLQLWLGSETLSTSVSANDVVEVPLPLFSRLVESLTYAA